MIEACNKKLAEDKVIYAYLDKSKEMIDGKFIGTLSNAQKIALSERNTFALLKEAILTILGNWCKGLPIAASLFDSIFGLQDAVAEQTEIGWNNFWVGRWSTKWQVVQKRYYKSINSKKSSRRWATAIVYKCILTAWDVWQFRNDLVHGPCGVKERALHASLDKEIQDQLAIGYNDLLHQDKVFF